MLEIENGKMNRHEYKQQYLYQKFQDDEQNRKY